MKGEKQTWRSILTVIHVYLIALRCVLLELWQRLVVQSKEPMAELRHKIEGLEFGSGDGKRKRRALVTGGSGAIGFEIVRLLLELEFEVIVLGRDRGQLEEMDDNRDLIYYEVDLSSMDQIRKTVEKFVGTYDYIDLFIGNAAMTVNGYEYHWAVNVLANALLINLLKPYILRSSLPFPRIVCVGSSTCAAGRIGENLVEGTMGGLRYFNGYQAYADSKLALAAYIDRLATDQLRESSIGRDNRITVYTVHPGVVPGRLYKNTLRPIQWLIGTWIGRLVLRSSTAAAFDVVNLCFNKDIIPGGYYEYGNRVTLPLDETVKKRVFESVNEAICG